MKILITGGTGFIGSHLMTLLEKKRHDVSILSFEDKVIGVNGTEMENSFLPILPIEKKS